MTRDAVLSRDGPHGLSYTIRAILNGPNGQSARVTLKQLDVVVLDADLLAEGLKRGDRGAIVDVYSSDAFEVEFVTASGCTQALVTLQCSDVRQVQDNDLVTARPATQSLTNR